MTFRRAAVNTYRVAVQAFPRRHRVTYGDEMIAAFEQELASRARGGRWRAIAFSAAACVDTIIAGLGERRRSGDSQGEVMRVGLSWLDVKLGLRMLVRYPGLSLVGGLGIALVVVCGVVAGIFHSVINATLPFEEGDRVVAIENWDASQNRPARHDFFTWRDELRMVTDIGAYRLVSRNIGGATAAAGQSTQAPEPARIAEISASAFTIARVPPLAGRYLVPDDERISAPPVIVVGYDEWQRRFGGDPQLIGRTLQVGDTATTVVGVMPRGFGFPVNERYWIPLRLSRPDDASGLAPSRMPYKDMPQGAIHVFGRLADGADLPAAQSELSLVGQRAAAAEPVTHARLRPRVLPYTLWFFKEQHDGEIFLVQGLLALLLGIVGANVAVLVYARTATRRIEIALRGALGASRRRIVGQMFAEGLVLSAAAAAAGLLIAAVIRRELDGLIPWHLAPFWVNTSVTSGTALTYVIVLAVLGAVVVGAIPALQATGRRAQTGLQQAAANSSGWRIGRTYGILIVVQVTLAVAILPYAASTAWTSIREATASPGFDAAAFLTARVEMEPGAPPALRAELGRRMETESGASRVTFLTSVPGSEPTAAFEIEGQGWHEVGVGAVPADYFAAFGVPVLAGRGFDARDADPASRHVIVNRAFAQQIIGGNALGRRVRQAGASDSDYGPWLEIVGVVENFPAKPTRPTRADARLYRAIAPGDSRFSLLALHARAGGTAALAERLRDVATALDRRLLLRDIRSMDALLREQRIGSEVGAWASGLATVSLLLLSATGLYALMAFTVAQRRREIGIRVALGADPGTVVRAILSRAVWQLGTGVAAGVAVAALLNTGTADEFTGGAGLRILPAVAGFVLLIGLAAAAAPARRALRIQPTEAMREQ